MQPLEAQNRPVKKLDRVIFLGHPQIGLTKITPKPGQESVWDFPRPPKLVASSFHVKVVFAGITIADSCHCYRVLETSHPPTWYIPPADILTQYLHSETHATVCEFKGQASYWSLTVKDRTAPLAAWSYENPNKRFAPIKGYMAFYAARVDECYVNDEKVDPQAGDFYGGWATSDIVGPFKGGVGTWGW